MVPTSAPRLAWRHFSFLQPQPLLLTPLARIIGRTALIFWSLLGLLSCQIWAAKMTDSKDYIPLLISRLLAGMLATAPTIFGPSYAIDIFFLHQRCKAFISYDISFLGGVVAGPTIGGFIVKSKPWPYTFWWTIAPLGIAMVLVFCFLEETGFRRGKEDPKSVEQPTSFLKNRMATLFPGNRIIRQSGYQEVVGSNSPFDKTPWLNPSNRCRLRWPLFLLLCLQL